MLLNFTMTNYKSFREETVFSMEPDLENEPERISTSVLRDGDHTALATSVVYGANASGKTSLITAMAFFRAIIISNDLNKLDKKTVRLMTNSRQTKSDPMGFTIMFLTHLRQDGNKMAEKVLVSYHLSINVGTFFEPVEQRFVIEESLSVDGENIFDRKGNSINLNREVKINRGLLNDDYTKVPDLAKEYVDKIITTIESNQLYLNKVESISTVLSTAIKGWFNNKFQPLPEFNKIESSDVFASDPMPEANAQFLKEALRSIGSVNDIIQASYDDGKYELRSVVLDPRNDKKGVAVSSIAYESLGTMIFAKIVTLICDTLLEGVTLIIDEFDASIHPLAIMNIIKLFHDPEINKNHAQLIFNTHNPIFLNNALFRRDEIKFTQRDPESGESELYSLADFKNNSTEIYQEYMHDYLADAFGGVNAEMNFFPIFEKMMKGEDK